MKDLFEIVKSLEDSGLLLKRVSKKIRNESKEQKGGFLSTLLGTLSASLLENILAGKGAIISSSSKEIKSASQGRGVNGAKEGARSVIKKTKSKRQVRGIVRAGYGNKKVRKTTTKNKKKVFNATSSFN